MSQRKHISLKTKLASALLALGHVPYDDAKQMTEDQLISLYQFDHNMLYWSKHEHVDEYWNLQPMLIPHHRRKTKQDAKVIAKGRRISATAEAMNWAAGALERNIAPHRKKRKIRSRGFDKTRRRRMDGTVVKR